jgi:putative ABC transport system permease protein
VRSLGALGVRNLRRAVGRSLLTAGGVTLGVAVLFGVLVANASASRAFSEQFLDLSVPNVAVRAPDGELPPDAVARLAAAPDVYAVNAFVGFQARIVSGREVPDAPVWVSGAERATGEAFERRERVDDEFASKGRTPRGDALEISISDFLATELAVGVGSAVALETPTGRHEATVTEVWRRTDGTEVKNSNIAATVEAVRRVGGPSTRMNFANVRLASGTDAEAWVAQHRGDLGSGVVMSRNGPDPVEMGRFMRVVEGGFAAGAGLAVFIGGYVIFLTLSMQVAERAAVFGTLRALGATRGQVAQVVLVEGAALGVVATAAGLAFGLLAAFGLNRIVAGLYEIDQPDLYVPPVVVGLAISAGIGITLVAAFAPAWRAARNDPIVSMQSRPVARERLGRLWVLGVFALVVGLAWSFTRQPSRTDPSLLLILAGSVFVLPVCVGPTAALMGRITRRAAPGVGDVGVLHLVKERSRSAYTMGLVMVVLAMVLTLGTTEHTYRVALDRILDRVLATDVVVNPATGFDHADLAALDLVDGVARSTAFREVPTVVAGAPRTEPISAYVTIIDPDTYFASLGFPWVDGDDAAARSALARTPESGPPGVVLTDTQADKLGVTRGGTVRLTTPGGPRSYRVTGTVSTLDQNQRVVIGLAAGRADFGVGSSYFVRVTAEDGVTAPALEQSIRDAFRERTDLTFTYQAEERAQSAAFMNRYFGVFLVVLLVALVVGMLGLANTLALAVFRRTRELGVLRAIGTQRRQLAAMVAVEAVTLSAAAALLAIPLGALLAYVILRSASANLELFVAYAFDWAMVPVVALIALVLAVGSSVAPARRAARVDPVVALRFE